MNEKANQERKRYEKPEVRRVTLKPEESLVAGCKTLAGSSPSAPACGDGSCFSIGS